MEEGNAVCCSFIMISDIFHFIGWEMHMWFKIRIDKDILRINETYESEVWEGTFVGGIH